MINTVWLDLKKYESVIMSQIVPSKRWSESDWVIHENSNHQRYRLDSDFGRSVRLEQDCLNSLVLSVQYIVDISN